MKNKPIKSHQKKIKRSYCIFPLIFILSISLFIDLKSEKKIISTYLSIIKDKCINQYKIITKKDKKSFNEKEFKYFFPGKDSIYGKISNVKKEWLIISEKNNRNKNKEKNYVTIDFSDVEITIFIRYISEVCLKNFAIDKNVKGKISLYAANRIDTDNLYEVFKKTLLIHGYSVIESDDIITIIPTPPKRGKIYYRIIYIVIIHASFWFILILSYPKSPQVQAIFFWNPYARKFIGLFYIHFALTWVPFLRQILFKPFRKSLLSDALLHEFDEQGYFPNSDVLVKKDNSILPINIAIPKIRGQIILEGESGLGKSMFLRYLAKHSERITVFLEAKRCAGGF
jgi:hypothetical protein